jgi:hypothetical protein
VLSETTQTQALRSQCTPLTSSLLSGPTPALPSPKLAHPRSCSSLCPPTHAPRLQFPGFGLAAAVYTWVFDFSLATIGVGLIAPGSVAYSLLVSAQVAGQPHAGPSSCLWPRWLGSSTLDPPHVSGPPAATFFLLAPFIHSSRVQGDTGLACAVPIGIGLRPLQAGAIVSWGILWPVLDGKAGAWYPAGERRQCFMHARHLVGTRWAQ